MNILTDKKPHVNSNKKKKAQHKPIKKNAVRKSKKKPSHRRPTRTTKPATSIVIATNQPTLDAPIVFMSTPLATTPLTLSDNSELDAIDQGFFSEDDVQVSSTAAAAAIHKMEDTETVTTQPSNSISTATRVTQIAAPVIGVFGGIALIAAAMFYVVRKRKRNSILMDDTFDKYDYDNDNKYSDMHDISLLDDDEAIMAMGQPPKLTPATIDTTNTTNMNRHHHNNCAIINVPETHPVNNSSDMKDTTSRCNSLNLPPLSYRNDSSCRSSTTSTVYADALTSPRSSMFGGSHYISSFLMIAERQQLQHHIPSILDHYNNNNEIKSSRSTPIETYKAQLANLDVMDDQDQELEQELGYVFALPFSMLDDFTDIY